MEDDKKRWTVTYSKHIKQKRKVYQDGFLDLHISTNKVMLYDDCEKLLECRILKKDELVTSGETLTFNAYFVSVGDPEGDHKPLSDLNSQTRDRTSNHKPRLFRVHKFKNSSISSEDRECIQQRNKAQMRSLSPSRKIIREFKRSELQKYGAAHASPDTVKTSTAEWQVLYTMQLTQKAKKYHDGFLQFRTRGSLGRQVTLFDASRKQLDSRFLKKDEVIESGISITLDGHLVEVGEYEANLVQGNNLNISGKEIRHGTYNLLESDKSVRKEWQVMYTTQLTKKAKKYHDGFLQIADVGTQGRQVISKTRVMLYDTSKKLLVSRFLKKDEVIRSGELLAFDTHLVDIGESEENSKSSRDLNSQKTNRDAVGKIGTSQEQQHCPKIDKYIVKGKPQKSVSSVEHSNPTFCISKPSKIISSDKPLRDAHQILSILQKPVSQERISDGPCPDSIMRPVSPVKKLQDSGSAKSLLGDSQFPRASISTGRCSENVANLESSQDMDMGKLSELPPFLARGANQFPSASSDPIGNERKSSKELESAGKTNECPSFDLGF
ncbi:uncharacterized protein LOC110812357 isoform X2 [Carica papaya]|uniref:uncharacterized protein LOC110812357 isoform X2 n=1 Tax=Carica papaya TaxID=3649 RepID=UPI000B8CFB87|nr:uncharacterized protein LOC110812357 isoform X2 [Carica papaya]